MFKGLERHKVPETYSTPISGQIYFSLNKPLPSYIKTFGVKFKIAKEIQ